LHEVQNRREMVAALGDIADPAAVDALGERLMKDEYVPVRAEAATALAKIAAAPGGPRSRVLEMLRRAQASEREPMAVAATRKALAALGDGG
jgi:HEAT repeat protein